MNFVDPGNTDHMVAMTQLREQLASLKKQVAEKEKIILDRDKKVIWCARQFKLHVEQQEI